MAKIIVVEDELPLWKLYEYKLKRKGHQPLWAPDGEKALELISRENPDLILLDLMIPFPDGLHVLKTIKSDEQLSSIPVIIVSSQSMDETVLKGLRLGADDYLTKPFSPEELLLRIEKILIRAKRQPL